jgi:HYR domain
MSVRERAIGARSRLQAPRRASPRREPSATRAFGDTRVAVNVCRTGSYRWDQRCRGVVGLTFARSPRETGHSKDWAKMGRGDGVFGSMKSRMGVSAIVVALVGLPVLGVASPASALSSGCSVMNGRSGNAASFGEDGLPWDAGDQLTVTATGSGAATAVIVQVNGVTVASTPFPGTVVYTFPTAGTPASVTAGVDIGNAQISTSCVHPSDVTPPTLTLPADITVNATSPSGASVTYNPPVSATDPVDGVASLACVATLPATTTLTGGSFPIGTTTVNCSATDTNNNTATGSFQVTVNQACDKTQLTSGPQKEHGQGEKEHGQRGNPCKDRGNDKGDGNHENGNGNNDKGNGDRK